MIIRTFGSFNFEEVEELFGIEKMPTLPLLTEWLSAVLQVEDVYKFMLNRLKDHLLEQVLNWNEDELKMFFIGPLIELAKIETKDFKPFTQRALEWVIDDLKITGKVDFMIAKGKRTAKPPYFCIHEYKQEGNASEDPLGQLLIAMVVGQELNEHKFPMLGAYVVGRSWFFVILSDKQYAVSNAYNAADDDIFQIFAILQKSKEIITRYI